MQIEERIAMELSSESHGEEDVGIERVLSIWPIISCFALYVSAGDLISLSRTSSALRAITHGFPIDNNPFASNTRQGFLRIGDYQTAHWANLKALSRFECSSSTHRSTKQYPTCPCRFCSKPICKACIVRNFFTNPRDDTFKHRTRYLCPTCWESGNLRKDFRHPIDHVSREHIWRGRSYTQRGSYCSCSGSSDNWLCIPCKTLQNASAPTNQNISEVLPNEKERHSRSALVGLLEAPEPVRCFGLDCPNEILEADRERRRICLWCSKPLPRQYAGEDRLRWESRQVEIRAAAAASRSADIAEWARNRFRSLTMSRREMRGSEACLALSHGRDSPEHDQPIFVKHLDAVNYRRFMIESDWLSPDSVYQSKHGRWTYTRGFLMQVNERFLRHTHVTRAINGVSAADLFGSTHTDAGLFGARTNLTLALGKHRSFLRKSKRKRISKWSLDTLARHQAILWEVGLVPLGEGACKAVVDLLTCVEALDVVIEQLLEQVDVWHDLDEAGKLEWRPPSLRLLVEDAEQSFEIMKKARNDGQAASSMDEDSAHAEGGNVNQGIDQPDAYMHDLSGGYSDFRGKVMDKHSSLENDEENGNVSDNESESESESASEVDLMDIDSNRGET